MLASAFCGADDRVREAQAAFDGTQAERARLLAAFAVTVGSDAAVAELLGLGEREVRVARRTVGKSVAASLAESLLTESAAGDPDAATGAPGHIAEDDADDSYSASAAPVAPPPEAAAPPRPVPPQPPVPLPRVEGVAPQLSPPAAFQEWSPALDSFLADGWNRGIDASTLAARLGIGLSQLVARAQTLSADGRLTPVRRDGGRHRRPGAEGMAGAQSAPDHDGLLRTPPAQTWPSSFDGVGIPGQSGAQYQDLYGQDDNGWAAARTDTLPRHDWDGILHDWNRAHSAER
ncbi:hypothetical protein ACFVW8_23690 [Streptomyces sp. NPDC058221]|uniref:hypothetical protein n=1 Tax=Streptomyces sp. NPDC058221 TaxID=3346388 RepID=UPI0036E805C0